MTLVLAFDIERSGSGSDHQTIAIGASVVTEEFEELDSLFLPMYSRTNTRFEPRCFDEFWSKHLDILEKLRYVEQGSNASTEEIEHLAVTKFQDFRRKWETYAEKNEMKLELVTDNNVYDGGYMNTLISKYTKDLTIPYSTSQKYSPFWDVFSQQRGLLMVVDPEFKGDWGISKRIAELYDIPPMTLYEHDHLPHHDAYTIGFDQQVLLGIRDGLIKKRVPDLEKSLTNQ
jgi:hypothetical protein